MPDALVDFLALLGALSLVSLVIALIWWYRYARPEGIPKRAILELDLSKPIVEVVPQAQGPRAFMRQVTPLLAIVDALKKAESDDRVAALFIHGGGSLGFGTAQELRQAIASFRTSGKRAVFFADTFGEMSAGLTSYYLATACDAIYLQPSGDVGLAGPAKRTPFLKQLLDKVGVEPELEHRHEYKNALNVFTEEGYTEAHRESDEQLLTSLFETFVEDVAEARGWTAKETRSLAENGPYLAREALEAGLVDGLFYRDEVIERLREDYGQDAQLYYVQRYFERAGTSFKKGETVAVIYGAGAIQRGESQFNPMNRSMTMGAQSVSAAFRAAVDDGVRAILFRIDSPGGSYVASDTIWREVHRARRAGIPVIASMSNVAGSGGYFVAMATDRIVAHPSTLTGSIGVVGGKMLTRGFWEKVGVSWEELRTTDNASMWSTLEPYSERTRARRDTLLDTIYDDFTGKVAEDRGLSAEQIDAAARGRVWTGRDALEHGLVDALGGLDTALALLREACDLAPDAPLKLQRYPRPQPFYKRFRGPSSSEHASLSTLSTGLAELLRPATTVLSQARSLRQGVLRMPESLGDRFLSEG